VPTAPSERPVRPPTPVPPPERPEQQQETSMDEEEWVYSWEEDGQMRWMNLQKNPLPPEG